MFEKPERKKVKIGSTFLGIVLATAVFIFVSVVGHILFALWDIFRVSGDGRLQVVLREVIYPVLAGYAAIYSVEKWVTKASARFVFFGLATLILLYAGFCIGLVAAVAAGMVSGNYSYIGGWDIILAVISLFGGILGAFIYCKVRGINL